MDGVLIKEGEMIPGADKFIQALKDNDIEYMVLTNNSMSTPRDLSARLRNTGLDIPAERIWTSATATANFLSSQVSSSKAYVVGESGLTTAMHEAGWILTNDDPDFVVLGETRTYSFEAITNAINLIRNGMEAMGAQRHGNDVCVRLKEQGEDAIIEIQDQGGGISPDLDGRLFNAFATTKPQGMGMGLKICRSIVELHRGQLSHFPAPGGGTVFRITLPRTGILPTASGEQT